MMDEGWGEEPFEIDADLRDSLDYLNKRYSSVHAHYMAHDLLSDVQTCLACRAVAMLRATSDDRILIDRVHPKEETPLVENILEEERLPTAIGRLFFAEPFGGVTLAPGAPDSSGRYSGDVDLIPLPRLADNDAQIDVVNLIMLVEPNLAQVPSAQRDFQRAMLAQFLTSWWVKIMTPKAKFAGNRWGQEDIHQRCSQLADLQHLATVKELVSAGSRCSKHLRQEPLYGVFIDDPKLGTSPWFWDKWMPSTTAAALTDVDVAEVRRIGKKLFYWCLWVGSHYHLESASSPARDPCKGNETTDSSQDPAIEDRTEAPKAGDSLRDWVRARREDVSPIDDRLDELRTVSAEAFAAGAVPGLRPSSRSSAKDGLNLNSKALLRFSLNRWLSPGHMRDEIHSGSYSDVEFCRLLHGIAVPAHYALADQPLDDDVVHRLMQNVAFYGHRELGIPPRLDLRAHLLHTARGEPALHVLKPFYRDHFFHALEVCFLGHVLLETKLKNKRKLWQYVAKHLRKADKTMVLRLWYMAALLHDVGYAMNIVRSSSEYLRFFQHSPAMQQVCQSFEEALERLSKADEVAKVGITSDRGVGQDHGVVGALHLRSLLERIAKDDSTLKVEDYEPAIRAIALHNLRRSNESKDKIVFKDQPLAFLLAVCDQLQEWSRPRLTYSTAPVWLLARLRDAIAPAGDLEEVYKSLSANIDAKSANSGKIRLAFPPGGYFRRRKLELTATYTDLINRNSGVFMTWLDATLNFQRLDFDGLPLDIALTFDTPQFIPDDGTPPQPQLFRLRDAAYETHMSFLYDWFPTKSTLGAGTLTNGAVTYKRDDGAYPREKLTLDLRALAGKALITRDMDAFLEHLRKWKRYNEDRDFLGDYVPVIPE